jgi:site-specific DNA-methyltransferase (adenine-specific)
MWVFGSMRMFMDAAIEFRSWKLSQDIVWEKQNGSGFFNDRFRRVHEVACHFYPATARWGEIYKAPQFTLDARPRVIRRKAKPAQWTGARGATNFVSEDGGPRLQRSVMFARNEHGRALHPTQKPIAILAPLIRYACPPGGTLLDPFMGAGSAGVVARHLGLRFIGIEANPKYFEIACRRIEQEAIQPELGLAC